MKKPDHEPADRRAPTGRPWLQWGLCGLGVGALAWGAVVGVAWWRERQGAALRQWATTYEDRGQTKEALMSVETALRLNWRDMEALRLLARLQAGRGERVAALAAYGRLREAGGLTLEEARRYVQLAAAEGDWTLAESLCAAAVVDGTAAAPWLLQATLEQARGERAAALEAWRRAVAVDSGDQAKAGLMRLLLASRGEDAPARSEAEVLMRELATRAHSYGAEALVVGLESGVVVGSERAEWIDRLRRHPAASAPQRWYAEELRLANDPSLRPVVTAQVAAALADRPLSERSAGARWLMRQGAAAPVAQILSRGEAMAQPEMFLLWLEALAQSGRWQDLLDGLAVPGQPLEAGLVQAWRGRAWRALGRTDDAETAFREALDAPGPTSAAVLSLMRRTGESAVVESRWARAFADASLARETLESVAAVSRSQGDAALVLWVYEVAAASPLLASDPAVQNERDYWQLVLNQPVAWPEMIQRVEQNPLDRQYRLTLALAWARRGPSPEAMRQLENFLPDWASAELSPRERVVLVGALASGGQAAAAQATAAAATPRSLTLQERLAMDSFLAPGSRSTALEPQPAAPGPAAATR